MNNVLFILYTVYSSLAQMYRIVYYLLYVLCIVCTLYFHKTKLVGVGKLGLCKGRLP